MSLIDCSFRPKKAQSHLPKPGVDWGRPVIVQARRASIEARSTHRCEPTAHRFVWRIFLPTRHLFLTMGAVENMEAGIDRIGEPWRFGRSRAGFGWGAPRPVCP